MDSLPAIRSENTAIKRRAPSKPVKTLVESGLLARWNVRSILDYGCGYGSDVTYLHGLGFDAAGYDPHLPFGFGKSPHQTYDLVDLIFVLNILPSTAERQDVLHKAVNCLNRHGRLFIVARSVAEIERQARDGNWARCGDGYLSNPSRGMFQHGLSTNEMVNLATGAGSKIVEDVKLTLGSSVYLVAQIG